MSIEAFVVKTDAADEKTFENATPAEARVGLGIESVRSIGDTNADILITDSTIIITAISAPRTWEMPLASTAQTGQKWYIRDPDNVLTSSNTLTIARKTASSDTINGASAIVIFNAGGGFLIEKIAASKYSVIVTGIRAGGTGATTEAGARANLAVPGLATANNFTAAQTITINSATALTVGRQGATDPVLQVDSATASVVTGLKLTGAAAAGRFAMSVISSGADEGLSIDAKGAGTIRLNATGTGAIEFSRNAVPTANDGSALGTTALGWADLHLATGAVINYANGNLTLTHASGKLTNSGQFTSATMGIGTGTGATTPQRILHLDAGAGNTLMQFTNNTTGAASTDGCFFGLVGASGDFYIRNQEANSILMYTSDTLRLEITSAGLLSLPVDRQPTFTNQTSSAGASSGTLLNAPAAGNPGFWLKVKVNGTDYAIPCWAG